MKSQFFSVEQLSEILNLHPKTIQRFIREGKIKGTKIGRSWKVHTKDLKEFTHSELSDIPRLDDKVEYSIQPSIDRIQVSSVIEINEKEPDEASRLSNSLMAMMNCKDPSWGYCDLRVIHYPEKGKARIVINGSPKFISEMMMFFQVLLDEDNEKGGL